MTIKVIQYLLPNGRQVETFIDDMPDDLGPIIGVLEMNGMRLASEMLTTGHISFTVESLEHETDMEIEVCDNGPGPNGTAASLERMIRRCTVERIIEFLQECHSSEQA